MSQVYKSYQKPLDHNDLWHNLDDNKVYVFDKNKNEWKPISDQDGSSNPGFSPVVSINKVGTKTEIKITDSEGDHIANIYDGEDGPKGDPGPDGFSPTIQAERVANGVKLTITDKNGPHSAVLNDGIGDGSTVSTFGDVPSDGKSYLRQNGTWVEGATKAELNAIGTKVGELSDIINGSESQTEFENTKAFTAGSFTASYEPFLLSKGSHKMELLNASDVIKSGYYVIVRLVYEDNTESADITFQGQSNWTIQTYNVAKNVVQLFWRYVQGGGSGVGSSGNITFKATDKNPAPKVEGLVDVVGKQGEAIKAQNETIDVVVEGQGEIDKKIKGRLYPFIFDTLKTLTQGQFTASTVDVSIPYGKFTLSLINHELIKDSVYSIIRFYLLDGTYKEFTFTKSVDWKYTATFTQDIKQINFYYVQGGGDSVIGSGDLTLRLSAVDMTDEDKGIEYTAYEYLPASIEETDKKTRDDFKAEDNIVKHQACSEHFLNGRNPWVYHFNLDWNGTKRPVVMGQTINDIRIAKRLGFDMMEFNTHITKDGVVLTTHGEGGKLGYGFIGANGEDVSQWVYTAHTFAEFESIVRVDSVFEKYKEKIPTLEECLRECVRLGIKPYINVTGAPQLDIIDKVMGNNCYYLHGNITNLKLNERRGYYGQALSIANALAACDNYDSRFLPAVGVASSIEDGTLQSKVDQFHAKYVKVMTYDYLSVAYGIKGIEAGLDGALSTNCVNDFDNGNEISYTQLADFEAGEKYDATTETITFNANDTYTKTIGNRFLAKASLHLRFVGKLKVTMGGVVNYIVENDGLKDSWLSCSWLNQEVRIDIVAVEQTTIYDATLNISKC